MSSKKREVFDDGHDGNGSTPYSLTRPISPPRKRRRTSISPKHDTALNHTSPKINYASPTTSQPSSRPQAIKSPFQLTKIRDLPPELNRDAVTLKDLLGDPLISECWEFNYIHDINFLMEAFDEDTRGLVKVHVVHGFWKREDPSRLQLQEDASQFPNVTLHAAYLPEMFGTHHTKMLILLRHDDTAQIIIHTANMIEKDWTNMTQAVWSSPRLPLLPRNKQGVRAAPQQAPKTGNGAKFKIDFLNYLRSYDKNRPTCKEIANKLVSYDFSSIRGSLIASVPGRYAPVSSTLETTYGWLAFQQSLKTIPHKPITAVSNSHPNFLHSNPRPDQRVAQKHPLPRPLGNQHATLIQVRSLAIVQGPFPNPSEIRRSLDGYLSGGSIHTKISSAQQIKQLQYLQPLFHHWANNSPAVQKSGRETAAPHIKTYIRFSSSPSLGDVDVEETVIDWALLTSANLSKQAWGDTPNPKTGEVRICSYELGVLVWPGLYAEEEDEEKEEGGVQVVMKPTFLTDSPTPSPAGTKTADPIVISDDEDEDDETRSIIPQPAPVDDKGKQPASSSTPTSNTKQLVVVGLRMPYSLPLQPYGPDERPWVATATYTEPDRMGRIWSR